MKTFGILLGLTALCLILMGCSEKKEGDSVARSAGKKVGSVLTDISSGIGEGIDKQMLADVRVSDAFKSAGFGVSTAKFTGMAANDKGVIVYLTAPTKIPEAYRTAPTADDPSRFTFFMIMKAFNAENKEVARNICNPIFGDDDAAEIKFVFSDNTDMRLIQYFTLDFCSQAKAKASATDSAQK